MQNLSFQLTQNTPLKNISEPINKSDTNLESVSSEEGANAPFQLILSKQLQAKTKQDSDDKVKTENNKKNKVNNAKNNNDNGDLEASLSPSSIGTDGLGYMTSLAKNGNKEEIDNNSNVADIKPLDTNASAVALILQAVPMDPSQISSEVASSIIGSQIPSKLEAATQNLKSIVAGFGNSLLQSKYEKISDRVTENIQSSGNHEITLNQDNLFDAISKQSVGNELTVNNETTGAIKDSVISSAAWQTINDESSKLLLGTVKESIGKDTSDKGMPIPISYQPVMQISVSTPMQQAGHTNSINAYPGKMGWDQAISQKVVWMVGAGEQSATLTLNPPDLGPLQVVINVHNDKADTTFISNNAEVRQALQDGMSNLREKMGESGIQLGQANVSSGGQSQQDFQQTGQNRSSSQINNIIPALSDERSVNVNTSVRVANGLVDTFI